MNDTLNLLIAVAMGVNLIALASSRLPSVIRAAAVQGIVLGVLAILIEPGLDWLVGVVALGTVVVKGFVIPSLLRRALRAANIDREMQPLLGFVPSLLLGAAATLGAIALSHRLPLRPEHAHSLLAPGGFATFACGLILLMSRSKAISQVCGYLILENGIYLFGLMLIRSMPLMVEAGILLDLTVMIFVVGIIMDRIQKEFDTLDTRKLTVLRE
jgi:hydrogenase-4 component E